MKALIRLFRRASGAVPDAGPTAGEEAPRDPPPRPERLTYAIGDIHGRLDLLERMIDEIARDAGTRPHDIVFLGDYVDRGPESAGVLRRLHELDTGQSAYAGQAGDSGQSSQPARITCLMGNHDYMMLHFIADPEDGVNWLLVGGGETLASFGIPALPLTGGAGGSVVERVSAQAAALAAALGDDLTDWLASRPLWWRSGDLVAVHALTDPEKAMEEQDDEVLLWARPGRDLVARADGTWVVHGHTLVAEPTLRARHVNVDTGAFRGGPLTAAVFAPGEAVRFLPVASSGAQNA